MIQNRGDRVNSFAPATQVLIWLCVACLLAAFAAVGATSAGAATAESSRVGKLVAVADAERGGDGIAFQIQAANGRHTNVDGRPSMLRPHIGETVEVSGAVAEDGTLNATSITPAEGPAGVTGKLQSLTSTTLKVGIILAALPGDSASLITKAQAQQIYATDTHSVKAFYEEQSDGAMSLSGATDPNGDVFGPYTLSGVTTSPCAALGDWATAARQAATADGFVASNYDRIVYVYSNSAGYWCPFNGQGEMPGDESVVVSRPNELDDMVRTAAHELGHNLGVHHSGSIRCTLNGVETGLDGTCINKEPEDFYDIMGKAPYGFAGPNAVRLGFMDPANVATYPGTGTFDYQIAPGFPRNAPGATQMVRVPRAGFSGQSDLSTFYMDFRYPNVNTLFEPTAGTDGTTGVAVRVAPSDLSTLGQPGGDPFLRTRILNVNGASYYTPSSTGFFAQPLQVNQSFYDSVSNLRFSTLSTGSGGATLRVGPPPVAAARPTVAIVGGVLTYDASSLPDAQAINVGYDASNSAWSISDLSTPLTLPPGSGCSLTAPNVAICPNASVQSVNVKLGDGDDSATFLGSLPGQTVKTWAGAGADVIRDTASTTSFLFTAYGEAGTDSLQGGGAVDYLYGGDDRDDESGAAGNDYLDGGDGNDSIYGGDGADVIYARDYAPLDYVYCEGNTDLAYVDPGDTAAADCETQITPIATVSSATSPSTVALTTEGTADWAHWGATGATSWVHKSNGGSQVSAVTAVGGATITQLTGITPTSTWTDGTPTAASTSTTQATGVTTGGASGRGVQFTVNASDTLVQSLNIYAGVAANTSAQLQLSWQSNPGVTVASTTLTASGSTVNSKLGVSFRAPIPGDKLVVKLTQTSTGSAHRVRLYSATLSNVGTTVANASDAIDLTLYGQTDWTQWGSTGTSLTGVGRAGVTAISAATKVGSGTVTQATDTVNPISTLFSWANGDTVTSNPGTKTGVATGGAAGRGFSFTIPASATESRRLRLFVGATATSGKLELFWGSSSTPVLVDTRPNVAGTANYVYSINLRHNTAATPLKAVWTQSTSGSSGRVTLQAAVAEPAT